MSKKLLISNLNIDEIPNLTQEENRLLTRLYKTMNVERILWKVTSIVALVCAILQVLVGVAMLVLSKIALLPRDFVGLQMKVLVPYIVSAITYFVIAYVASGAAKKIYKYFTNDEIDHRNTYARCTHIESLLLAFFFSTPSFVCFLINFCFARSYRIKFDELFDKLYAGSEKPTNDLFSFKKFLFGTPAKHRFDNKVELNEQHKKLINTLYKMVYIEYICWTLESIAYYVLAIVAAIAGIYLIFSSSNNEALALLVLTGTLIAVAVFVVFGALNNLFANKAGWYVNTDFVDHRYTISRCSNFGFVVAGFFFNVTSMVVFITEFAFVKKHKKAFREISELIADSYDPNAILEVRHLCKNFTIKKNIFGKSTRELVAVNDVSFTLKAGETLGIVGESGCGKTTMGRAILKLHQPTAGQIVFNGKDISRYGSRRMRAVHKKMQIIFQDPYSSLPPRSTVGDILSEPVHVHKIVPKSRVKSHILDLMDKCGLRDYYYERYPHEFSGGQRQRICIARALSVNPSLVICDEPVSALDVSIQAQIINLLKKLQQDMNLTYVFISHDLSVVKFISDKIGVMYLGSMMEYGTKEDIFSNPLHPYTQALFSAIPHPDPNVKMNRIILKGDIPSPANPPKGCRFHTRCPHAKDICKEVAPTYKDFGNGHCAACHLLG